MSNMPDDIERLAMGYAEEFLGMHPCYPEQFELVDCIARAILSERTKAAEIAEAFHHGYTNQGNSGLYAREAKVCSLISQAIRKGGKE